MGKTQVAETMNRLLITLSLFALITVGTPFAEAAYAVDAYWQKALSVAQNNRDWIANRVVMELRQYNGKGEKIKSGSTWISRTVDADGKVNYEVERFGDGALKGNRISDDTLRGQVEWDIFARENQDRLQLTFLGNGEPMDGVPTLLYRYTLTTEAQGILLGKVWLSKKSGIPIKVISSPEEPSGPVDSSQTTVWYHHENLYRWYPEQMNIYGEGRILMIYRRIEFEIRFSDYSRVDTP